MESTYLFLLTCLAIYIAFKVRRIARLTPRRIRTGFWARRLFGGGLSEFASFSMIIPGSEHNIQDLVDYKVTNIGLVRSITLAVIARYYFPEERSYYLGTINLICSETTTPSSPQGEAEVETLVTPNGAVRKVSGTAYLSPQAFDFTINELTKGRPVDLSVHGRKKQTSPESRKISVRDFDLRAYGHPNGPWHFLTTLKRHMDEMDPEYNAPLLEFLEAYELSGHWQKENDDDE